MDELLKEEVMVLIKKAFAPLKADIISLFGSRAKGNETKSSDIDIMIFTKDTERYRKIAVKKGFRKEGEDAGCEMRTAENLLLEIKVTKLEVPKFDSMFYNDILSAVALGNGEKFEKFQKDVKKEFERNYEKLLFDTYIHFFNELQNLGGIVLRDDSLSKMNLYIKKGVVLQALLRLLIVMEGKPYCFDKNLAHEASKTKHWEKIYPSIIQMNEMKNLDDFYNIKGKLRDYIDSQMPKREYVGAWYKYLKKFKGF